MAKKETLKSDAKTDAKKTVAVVASKTIDSSIGLELKTPEELIDIIAAKDAEIAEKDAIIAELMENNASLSTAPAEAETVEVDGVKYIPVIKKFIHAGKTYTAEDVLKNPTVAASLVKSKSPALKKA